MDQERVIKNARAVVSELGDSWTTFGDLSRSKTFPALTEDVDTWSIHARSILGRHDLTDDEKLVLVAALAQVKETRFVEICDIVLDLLKGQLPSPSFEAVTAGRHGQRAFGIQEGQVFRPPVIRTQEINRLLNKIRSGSEYPEWMRAWAAITLASAPSDPGHDSRVKN
jgi:hypothetical protein